MFFSNNTWSNQAEWTWKPLPWWLALVASQGTRHTAKGETQLAVLLSCDAYEPQQRPGVQNLPKAIIVVHICWELPWVV